MMHILMGLVIFHVEAIDRNLKETKEPPDSRGSRNGTPETIVPVPGRIGLNTNSEEIERMKT